MKTQHVLLFVSCLVVAARLFGQAETVPNPRAPLKDAKGNIVAEGRHIILDSDSYPRPAAKLVKGPSLQRKGNSLIVTFALDRYDDVSVRIVDKEGRAVRRLGCGVLGPNAPEPFRKNSLAQQILWDGKTESGQTAPAGCKVEVAVGLTPRFERFIGYDPSQLLDNIIWLETDPQGRVYAQIGTGRKTDPVVLRFDRDGNYLDMVYPSNPKTLAATGRKLEDVWSYTSRYDGEVIPHRPRSWPTFVPYRSDSLLPFPMRIAADGTVWIAETTTGYPAWAGRGELFRLFTTQMDRFWFLETLPAMYSLGPFAIDGKGFGYLATSTSPFCTGTYPPVLKALNDSQAPGTIRKVNLETRALAADFEFNGSEPRAEKSAYLGTTQVAGKDAQDNDHAFLTIADLAVDNDGRLLVADGGARRLKVYAPNGRFLGDVRGLDLAGKMQSFAELRSVAATDDGFFLLALPEGRDRAVLAKCVGDPVRPRIAWSAELDATARHLAVDRSSKPVRVWVGMGAGPATLVRVTDEGNRAGDIKTTGGIKPRVFQYPWEIAADDKGRLFVHDREEQKLIRVNDACTEWKEIALNAAPTTMLVDRYRHRLLLTFSVGEHGGYSKERGHEPGLLSLDAATLTRQPFELETIYDAAEVRKKIGRKFDSVYPWAKDYAGQLVGVDAGGNLYIRDAVPGSAWHKATPTASQPHAGVIRQYGPDGRIRNPAVCRLFHSGGSVAMDSKGSFYAVDLPGARWTTVVHDFPYAIGDKKIRDAYSRDGQFARRQSEFTHLVKFGPTGGVRNTDTELWAHRGVSPSNGGGCFCDWPDKLVAVDAADRIYAADTDHHLIKVLDTAGNMVGRIGRWGNAETVPGPDGNARQLGFRHLYSMTAAGDSLYVSDKDLRRIAKVRMDYREVRSIPIP
ncbi:MAG: hypothetical protein FJ395_00720 [Verrucomicrobia bacterium]|nr:hypothetical protein [Verrucomicrobiota bacterium]